MSVPMQGFVAMKGQGPKSYPADQRKQNFQEIYPQLVRPQMQEQAQRCAQCGVPFCQVHCPVSNNIPDWLQLAAQGRHHEAYILSQQTNNFPEICGRICPQDRLCEGNCVIESAGHGTVTIGAIERSLTDQAWEQGWVQPRRPERWRDDASVGVIGAGPAGLAAAEELVARGIPTTVYDRYDRAGGLMMYGIPNFKLEKEIVARRISLLEQAGVRLQLGCTIGRDLSFADLRADHQAILIATGTYHERELKVPGVGLPGVVSALDYLIASNRKGLGLEAPDFSRGRLNAQGRRVVVVGGGDTAMDCLRTAIRQGAQSATCLYRRDRANMPGSQREVANAEEEGVVFSWLSAPRALDGSKRVARLLYDRTQLGHADPQGRRSLILVANQGAKRLDVDMVICALGYEAENLPEIFATPLACDADRTLAVDSQSYQTSLAGVFAAGDIVRGASLVVWAIRDGRAAAGAILKFLEDPAAVPPFAAHPTFAAPAPWSELSRL